MSFNYSTLLELTFELVASINLLNPSATLKEHWSVLTKMHPYNALWKK